MDRILKTMMIIASATATASPAVAANVTANVTQGRSVFQSQCATCHGVKPGAPGIGPSLFGVIGRKAGSLPNYSYSHAMKSAGFVWSPERLEAYLPAPQKAVPGDKMPYAGLKDPAKLAEVVAYLETLK